MSSQRVPVHRRDADSRRLLFTRRGQLAQTVTLKDGAQEWRFWPQGQTGIRLRRDDYVLFRLAAARGMGEPTITDADVVDFYMHKFADHRFQQGIVPYPAGVDPKQYEQMNEQHAQRLHEASIRNMHASIRKTNSPLTHSKSRSSIC